MSKFIAALFAISQDMDTTQSFSGSSVLKNPPANDGDMGSIPGSGRTPGEGNGNPLQYSRLGNAIVRGAGLAIIHGLTKELDMTE